MSEDQGEAAKVFDANFFDKAFGKLVIRLFPAGWAIQVRVDDGTSTLVSDSLLALVAKVCEQGDAAVFRETKPGPLL
jgi:membrane protein involved in colicin uptake